ncbi:glycosyltransferase [Streptomyces sp. NBC_00237]|uniref:glycosyltransferase n=1 Tax=Streptomyces sp. NBC_00237 TaxID=2975687 RepID=UPI00225745E3|nr:glycosyltransferase [Streptomyces sp. NBC_00237]MCX5201746.1 glycosyltransferase [Streptomyces sp. NBC_00237]
MNPRVSVVVPVHNTAPYLERCFGSVLSQSLAQDQWEVVAVDDGSTDGGGAWLDAFAREHTNVTVVHQEASGGAGKPRNVGIEHARGEFLFFLDSDDHLGPEALERLLAMADEHGSDVVYGRIVGGGGRPAPVDLRTSNPDVSLFDSPVYWTLAAYKLWRRTLIDDQELRFVENRLRGEDVPFAVRGLLNAGRISVVADHDCYVLEGRDDNSNASEQDIDWIDHLRHAESILRLVGDHVPAGADRDKLVERHFHGEILSVFGGHFAHLDEEARALVLKAARPLVEEWLTDRIFQALPPRLRLRAHCVLGGLLKELTEIVRADAQGEPGPAVVRDGRAFAPYPYFRDASRALPDACYDLTSRVVLRQSPDAWTWQDGVLTVTGSASLTLLPGAGQQVALVLRNGAAEHRVPATRTDDGAYRAEIDPGAAADGIALSEGNWTVRLEVGAPAEDGSEPLTKIAWLSAPDPAPAPLVRLSGGRGTPVVAASVYASEPHHHANLDIGAHRHPLGPDARAAVTRRLLTAPRITAAVTLPDCPADAELELVLALEGRSVVLKTETTRLAGSRFTLSGTLGAASEGRWDVRIRVRGQGFTRDIPAVDAVGGTASAVLAVPAHWKWTRRLTL